MPTTINVNFACIEKIDITPAKLVIEKFLAEVDIASIDADRQIKFEVLFPREPGDPRELPEIPEIRLWFICLDAAYPWLPYVLDWREELNRYKAMLVPHVFSRSDGIEFNPEAEQIFVMHKIFTIALWLKQKGISSTEKLQQMAIALGYEVDREFFTLL